jgi:photosystem II stability/assembly factor-like uncharacterized protein
MRLRKTTPFLLLLLSLASHAPAQWSALVSGTQTDLNDVFFIDAQTGWVAGDAGYLRKTTDGGASWIVQTADTVNLVSISFLDADTGYVLPEFSMPWVTYDGGATWGRDSALDGACYAHSLEFNDRILYLTYGGCFGGAWLYTLDPASKDTTQYFEWWPNPLYFGWEDFGFPEPGKAIAMGNDDLIARTTDAGDSWTMSGPGDTAMDWRAVDFISPMEGYAVTNHLFTPLYKTLDGGQTWVMDSTWSSTFFYPTPTDVDFRDPGYGYVVTDIQWSTQGVIFEVRPGAWTFYSSIPNVPRAIHMVTDSVGYVVGDSGMIWKRTGGPLAVDAAQAAVDFQVHPNPAQEAAMIFLGGHEAARLRIFHPDGRLVREMEAQPGIMPLMLDGMAGGVYVLRMEHPRGVAVRRLVVTR